jgi:protein-S-isoprenylcysteine O-methyltransferase Ste14
MIEEIGSVLHGIVAFLPSALSAPPPSDPPRLRVGLGGDIPVAPPIAMALFVAGGFAVSAAGSSMLFMSAVPPKMHISISVISTLIVGRIGAVIKRKCDAELAKAGTKGTFEPVSSLANTGPYAKSRNPMYVAILTAPIAVGLAAGNAVVAVGSSLSFWLYLHFVVVPAEEKFLLKQLGEVYNKYCVSVKRWGVF